MLFYMYNEQGYSTPKYNNAVNCQYVFTNVVRKKTTQLISINAVPFLQCCCKNNKACTLYSIYISHIEVKIIPAQLLRQLGYFKNEQVLFLPQLKKCTIVYNMIYNVKSTKQFIRLPFPLSALSCYCHIDLACWSPVGNQIGVYLCTM